MLYLRYLDLINYGLIWSGGHIGVLAPSALNGHPMIFLIITRSQIGWPYSPTLFIITADYSHACSIKRFQAYPSIHYRHEGSTLISNLSFAKDMIIFSNGQKQSITRILDCLEHYERVSSQLVNRDNGSLMLPTRTPDFKIKRLVFIIGFMH